MGRIKTGGKKKASKGKKKKSKKDREWSHEGAEFLNEPVFVNGASKDKEDNLLDDRERGAQEISVNRRRRMTQALQDQLRRGKLKKQRKLKQQAFVKKFDEAKMKAEALLASPPLGKPRRHRHHRGKSDGKLRNPYAWIHNKEDEEKNDDRDEAEKVTDGNDFDVDDKAWPRGSNNRRRGEPCAYTELMASLSNKSSQSKYREMIEQRLREQEGLTESEDSDEMGEEDQMLSDEDEESESESEQEESEAEDDEVTEETEGVDEEKSSDDDDVTAWESDDEEEGEGDSFVRHWQRDALTTGRASKLGAEESSRLQHIVTWSSQELGEEDGDSILVQATSSAVTGAAQNPLESLHLKKILKENWPTTQGQPSALQRRLYPLLASYQDLLFGGVTAENLSQTRSIVLLHVLNHVLKARSRVLRHNLRRRQKAKANRMARLSTAIQRELGKEDEEDEEQEEGKSLGHTEEEDRDQGFTRPRVLVLLPMRSVALKIIQTMVSLLGPNTSVSGMKRLEESYGVEEETEDERKGRQRKPEDWQQLFDGNCDDDFKLGLSLIPGQGKGKGAGKGVAMKLFSEFYQSDIIITSPLGLRLVIEAQGDKDFLSSIELLVLDQADVLLMQNWDHVTEVFSHINLPPQKDHNTDFSRVRHYLLEGQARQFRQSLILSKFLDPAVSAIFNKHCQNYQGKIRCKRQVETGSICQVALKIKQVFHRVPCPSHRLQGDARFDYMTQMVLPEIQRLKQVRTLIFIPSYYDFVRLRNYAVEHTLSHVCISEYERVSETSRGRARFFHGQRDLMLYTGRAHFFKRYLIRGAHHIIFYSLPENAHFYPELLNLLEEAGSRSQVTSCFVMFTRYEALALERVVGSSRSRHMLASDKSTFLFC